MVSINGSRLPTQGARFTYYVRFRGTDQQTRQSAQSDHDVPVRFRDPKNRDDPRERIVSVIFIVDITEKDLVIFVLGAVEDRNPTCSCMMRPNRPDFPNE